MALAGHPFTETYTGTLGPSVRSVAPIYDSAHHVVGLVSIGIALQQLSGLVDATLPSILLIAFGAVLPVGVGSWALSRALAALHRSSGHALPKGRYLEYLSTQRLATHAPRYGGAGRPEQVYRWIAR